MTHKIDLSCPKCGSDHTQKITSLVANGTSTSVSHTSTVGVGSVGGATAIYSSGGTTRGNHQTKLAQRFVKPRKKLVNAVLGVVIHFVLWGWIPAALVNASGHGFLAVITVMVSVLLLWRWSKKIAEQNAEYNTNVYPKEAAIWDDGFICHRCETVYIPD